MKHKLLFSIIFLCCLAGLRAQKLSFTGLYMGQHADLDAVIIKNLIRDCDTILVWPDTVLDLDALGIENSLLLKPDFEVFQNAPNPVFGKTSIKVNMPYSKEVMILVTDLTGRKISAMERKLDRGLNYFELSPGNYRSLLFSVISGNEKRSVKILSTGNSGEEFRLEFKGGGYPGSSLKSTTENVFTYVDNDMLEFTGLYDDQHIKIYDIPVGDQTYTFEFMIGEVVAGFEYSIDTQNSMKVNFTNLSLNAETYQWDFGDGNTSTNENPIHIYSTEGHYMVRLTATNSVGTDQVSQVLVIENTGSEMQILTGATEKTWKLIRDVSTERYPLQVGPVDSFIIWWAFGLQEDLAIRPCMLNDEWIFKSDGYMEFDDNGDYWAEGSIYPDDVDDMCASSTDPMINLDGVDVSAWSSGVHQFSISSPNLLTVTGTGAYIGLCKVGNNEEVMVPQEYVTYQIIKLSEGTTDTLIVQGNYMAGETPAYWRFVLVHYDNPDDEPPIPGPPPTAAFNFVINGLTASFTNESTNGTEYLWDFDDGTTSTEVNPVHTYNGAGAYSVTLTATNPNGAAEASHLVYAGSTMITDQILQGTWKIKDAPNVIFVGPSLGSPDWWSVPYEELQPGGEWYCMMNDEFTFNAGGGYEYRTNGEARNDGYNGAMSGCYTDTELSAMDFPFMSATHTYELITEGSLQRIILTNGPSQAAFIGFYKGYYGGENSGNSTLPNGGLLNNRYEVMGYTNNGTTESLFLSVDLNGDVPDGAAWSVILER